jgi:hypothetical protein
VNYRKPGMQAPVVSLYHGPAPVHNFVLLFLPPCGPHLILFGHWVHQAETTCLSTPRRPCKAKTFHTCSSPAPTQIKCNMHLQYSAKSHSTMLSITHHTREQPTTGSRMLQSSKAKAGGDLESNMISFEIQLLPQVSLSYFPPPFTTINRCI